MNSTTRPSSAVIIHGTMGSPTANWFPWMASNLSAQGFAVVAPRFPTPKDQNLESWLEVFDREVNGGATPLTLIGHSIGAAFALRVIERGDNDVRAAFLVAGFAEQLGLKEFDPLNAPFVEKHFQWEKIRARCPRFYLYAGDNDPYVPLACAERLSRSLQSPLRILAGGGHLNAEFGFTTFPQLLDDIAQLS